MLSSRPAAIPLLSPTVDSKAALDSIEPGWVPRILKALIGAACARGSCIRIGATFIMNSMQSISSHLDPTTVNPPYSCMYAPKVGLNGFSVVPFTAEPA